MMWDVCTQAVTVQLCSEYITVSKNSSKLVHNIINTIQQSSTRLYQYVNNILLLGTILYVWTFSRYSIVLPTFTPLTSDHECLLPTHF